MNIKKRISLFLFLTLFALPLPAQYRNEFSVSIAASPGLAYLYGDVAGMSKVSKTLADLDLQHVKLMIKGGIQHKIDEVLSHELSFAYGSVAADERKDTRFSYRGYAYNSQLYQLWWQPEISLFNTKKSRIYLLAGIGVVHSKSKMKGAPIRNTDTFKASATTALLPFGIGYEAMLSNRLSLGGEVACYYYYSDFIDGIKTKYSKANDVAGALFLSLSYRISGR